MVVLVLHQILALLSMILTYRYNLLCPFGFQHSLTEYALDAEFSYLIRMCIDILLFHSLLNSIDSIFS